MNNLEYNRIGGVLHRLIKKCLKAKEMDDNDKHFKRNKGTK